MNEAEKRKAEILETGETILLVDDDAAVRRFATRILKDRGYSVLPTDSGEAALEDLRRHNGRKIDLLITDVIMPGMSGRELAEEVEKAYPELSILFISGYVDDVLLRSGISEAKKDFLQKPFGAASFTGKVREILDKQAA